MKKSTILKLGLSGALFFAYKILRKKTNYDFQENRYVLLTGASTGIGKAIAEMLADHRYKVFTTVRKEQDAENLKNLSDNIIPVIMDVTDHESIIRAKAEIEKTLNGKKLYSVVNNAGIAVSAPIESITPEELKWQFEVNLFGLVDTTQQFLPLMDENNSKIINMSSVGGRVAHPFIGAYSASKHALEAISDSLRRELILTGIDVVVIQPGMINTPIWDKADEIDIELYKGTRYEKLSTKLKKLAVSQGKAGEIPEKVALVTLGILNRKRNKTRYTISKNPLVRVYLQRYLPDRTFDFVIKKLLFR